MKNFLIIVNPDKDSELKLTGDLKKYIEEKGGHASVIVRTKQNWSAKELLSGIPRNADFECILVLGGDGTLVRAARDLANLSIPLIGINIGTLGYLCELEPENVYSALDRIFENNFYLEKRMMMQAKSRCIDMEKSSTDAMNDIVIHWSGKAQMLSIDVSVDGRYLYTYSADGIIIATPTGSTAYSLAAGGPVVDPQSELILITPINSHGVMNRSIVVGSDSIITLALHNRPGQSDAQADMIFDGDTLGVMRDGDSITIRKSERYARVLRMDSQSFIQILGRKLNVT